MNERDAAYRERTTAGVPGMRPRRRPSVLIEFNDSEYRVAHGKAPRGYGGWAFEIPHGSYWSEEKIGALRAALPVGQSEVQIIGGIKPQVQMWVHRSLFGAACKAIHSALREVCVEGGAAYVRVCS